jgi:excisionase family DNA binding protein
MMSLRQVATELDVPLGKVRLLIATQALAAIRVGQVWRVSRVALARAFPTRPA